VISKSLRLSEKWFGRGLWVVAFVFAGFLIGLVSTIVGDLLRVEVELKLNDFIDKVRSQNSAMHVGRQPKRRSITSKV
jgi:hypothetical protein